MKNKLCFGCMEYTEKEGETCTCGFNEAEYEAEPHHLKPGTLLKERYQVGMVLGEGGFGITYVGRDVLLDLKIAVKEFYMSGYVNRNNTHSTLVRASVGTNAELFEKNKDKFLTEARVLAKFADEEGIVGIRDFFQENNTAYIVMDFLTGETLRDFLKRNKKIAWDETLQILNPVLKSLGNVHKHNVIHRDISPDNIMLLKDKRVKLLDFGAAREVSQTDIKSLSVILKPGYAPEEQYRSKGKQGPWTDIYALCATIYCCITGVVPEDSMERMFEDKLVSPCELVPTCSKAVSNVIMKGMSVRQNDRYQTIEDLQMDLEKALAHPEDTSIASESLKNETGRTGNSSVSETGNQSGDNNATMYAGEITENDKKAAGVADKNATMYAGEIVGNVDTTVPQKKEVSEQKPVKKAETKPGSIADQAPQKTNEQTVASASVKKAGNKKVLIIVVAAVALLIGIIVLIGTGGDFNNSSVNSSITSKNGLQQVPDGLQKYSIEINGTTIALPTTYQTFVDAGWELLELNKLETMLAPNSKSYYDEQLLNVEKGFGQITVRFMNVSSSYRAYKDCWIYFIEVDKNDINLDNYENAEPHTIQIAGYVQDLATLTTEKFVKVFPEGYTKTGKNTYEYGTAYANQTVGDETIDGYYRFYFYDEGNIMNVQMMCHKVPKDFEDTFNKEAPQYDEAEFAEQAGMDWYLKLNDAEEAEFEITSSVLVQSYLDAGWTVADGPESLGAGERVKVHLRRDARTIITATIDNPYPDATAIEACIVSHIEITSDVLKALDAWEVLVDEEVMFDSSTSQLEFTKLLDIRGITYVTDGLNNAGVYVYPFGKEDGRYIYVYFAGDVGTNISFDSQQALDAFF